MLKYEGRISSFCGGVETNVKCEGTPLTGKRLFRNELAQRYFDKLRNQLYLDDYGRLSEDNNTFYFLFLNGEIKYYTRRQILELAKQDDEEEGF